MQTQIMVVNESAELRELFHDILVAEGYTVEVYPFEVGEIDEIERVHPQLVIMDCSLGATSRGWTLLERLSSQASTASIPLIVASTSPQKLDSVKRTVRSVTVLPKPFELDDLLSVVAQKLVNH
jgi:CheY-like chemotaxis protein